MKKSLLLLCMILLIQSCGTGINSTFPEDKVNLSKIGKYAPKKVRGGVEFTYVTRGKKKSVVLAGSFNRWNKRKYKMKEVSPGIWKVVVPVPNGRHEYKFFINKGMWVADRSNPAKSDDGWGHSLILVSDRKVTFPSGIVSKDNPGYLYSTKSAYDSAGWIRDTVIYELFPRVYTKNGYQGLIRKLDYLTNLGVDTLWVMPTFPIGRVKRKGTLGSPYAVRDYYKINPEFGSEQDFRDFVDQAHARNMKVILDWVPNHSAWDNNLLKEHPEYYLKDRDGNIIYPPNTDWTDVAQFDYNNKDMRKYMMDALKYWVREYKIDGYRMDASNRVPHDFWSEVRVELQKINPKVLMLAESEEAHHHINGFDLTYSGAIRVLTQHIANGGDTQYHFHKKYNTMKYSYPRAAIRMHWMENHDGQHALKIIGRDGVFPAAVVHLTMNGVPLIHQGQEFGDTQWKGWKSLFDPLQLSWDKFDQVLFDHYQALIRLRKSSPAFTRGELILIENDQEKVISYARVLGQEKYLVVVNLSAGNQVILFNRQHLREAGLSLNHVVSALYLGEGVNKQTAEVGLPLELAPWQSVVIRLN